MELFVTDLDGTLLGADSRVSERSAAMLSELTARGAQITVATARTPATVVPLTEGCGFRLPQVVLTGAALWDPSGKKYLTMEKLSPESAVRVAEVVAECGLHPLLYRIGDDGELLHLYYIPEEMPPQERRFVDDRSDLELKKVHTVESLAPLLEKDGNILILALGSAEKVGRAVEMLRGDDTVSVSHYSDPCYDGVEFLEVFGPDVSKASGLRRLKALVGADSVTVFGDSGNDLPMMSVADRAVAVANATDQVKAAADVIIGPNTADSVPEYIAAQF